jgi:hypothetical protein
MSRVRWLAIAPLVLVLAGCGGSNPNAAPARTSKLVDCVSATPPNVPDHGYSICGRSGSGGRGPSRIVRGSIVVAEPVETVGRWLGAYLSPDGTTLLAQWSGACEIPVAYFVPAEGGRARPITRVDGTGSAESVALGWRGSRALVHLPRGEWPNRRPGVYVVDPKTMRKTLVRSKPPRRGC